MEQFKGVIDSLPAEKRAFIEDYFAMAPPGISDECTVMRLPEKEIFIRRDEVADAVYILVEGVVKAADYHLFGMTYDFLWFKAVDFFGAMETFTNRDKYMTTLMTDTPCTLIVIRRKEYLGWMKQDAHALFRQTTMITESLLEQARRERAYLHMQAQERMYILFTQIYESQQADLCHIALTRQEIGNSTGLSVKTVNRSVKKMQEEQLVEVSRRKITMSKTQYERMKEIVMDILHTGEGGD